MNNQPRIMITYQGVTMSRQNWARKIGITDQALARRLRHMPLDEAMNTAPHVKFRGHAINLTHNGVTKTLLEWSMQTGVPAQTLYTRFRDGRPTEEILSTSRLAPAHQSPAWPDIDKPWRDDEYAQKLVDSHPNGMTLDEIGEAMGICRERVRQLQETALRKLRIAMNLHRTPNAYLARRCGLPDGEAVRACLHDLTECRDRQTITYPEPYATTWSPERSGLVQRPENEQGERVREVG